eukprot:TRINITY_DN10423_c0_g2_i1.p1 TRINITY_DN10423_c0_g2~~TRINITY_DN10423_c0_g2_i1.p1  ORF type:complete len:235 (+),score=14.14 TRINITY_DN10423_c0_g2_i1:345-1049(+)
MSVGENTYVALTGNDGLSISPNKNFAAPPLASPELSESLLESSSRLSSRQESCSSDRARSSSTASTCSIGTAWRANNSSPASPKPRRRSSLSPGPGTFNEDRGTPPPSPTRPSLLCSVNHHGCISRQEAEARLRHAGMHTGMYLLREKQANRMYALSTVMQDRTIQHHIIERSVRKDKSLGNHFILNGKRLRDCNSVDHVIDMLKTTINAAGESVLTIPCPVPRTPPSLQATEA